VWDGFIIAETYMRVNTGPAHPQIHHRNAGNANHPNPRKLGWPFLLKLAQALLVRKWAEKAPRVFGLLRDRRLSGEEAAFYVTRYRDDRLRLLRREINPRNLGPVNLVEDKLGHRLDERPL
jgi:hypothetical protein